MICDALFLMRLCEISNAMKDKFVYSNSGEGSSWSEATKNKKSNCAHAVGMALQKTKILKGGQRFYFADKGAIKYVGNGTKSKVEDYFDVIKVGKSWKSWKKKAKAGDILAWNKHTSVYSGKDDKGSIFYDFGKSATYKKTDGSKYKSGHRHRNMDNKTLYYVYRLKKKYRILD